jgi:hypothetical protein
MMFVFRPEKVSHTIGINNDASSTFSRRNVVNVNLIVDGVRSVLEVARFV